MSSLLDSGVTAILLNLENLKQMDSSGVGELIRCVEIAQNRGATIKLLHAEKAVLGTLGEIEVFYDVSQAIASFFR